MSPFFSLLDSAFVLLEADDFASFSLAFFAGLFCCSCGCDCSFHCVSAAAVDCGGFVSLRQTDHQTFSLDRFSFAGRKASSLHYRWLQIEKTNCHYPVSFPDWKTFSYSILVSETNLLSSRCCSAVRRWCSSFHFLAVAAVFSAGPDWPSAGSRPCEQTSCVRQVTSDFPRRRKKRDCWRSHCCQLSGLWTG